MLDLSGSDSLSLPITMPLVCIQFLALFVVMEKVFTIVVVVVAFSATNQIFMHTYYFRTKTGCHDVVEATISNVVADGMSCSLACRLRE